MCGIVGGFSDRALKGIPALVHRGPDAQGSCQVGQLTFGHTRLAILDLDPRSNQPFQYGPLTLVFNGEIWNYQTLRQQLIQAGCSFQTNGDTEVLAAALLTWGIKTLPKLQGMFAIGWTLDGQTLYLARDRFGETPLHYCRQQPFFFASERKALQAIGCASQAIQDLEPGQVAIVTASTLKLHSYYSAIPHPQPLTRQEAAPILYRLIGDGTTERTISDVPVCTLLSGGIDSASVAYWLTQTFPRLVAYTAVYNPKSADLQSARQTAKALGIELREIPIPLPSPADLSDVICHIEMSYKAQIEIGWPCLCLAHQMQADGFHVTYSGEGSDELWASYGFAYHALKKQDWYSYRRDLFLSQARKNFIRCNKIFMAYGVECRLPFLHTALVEFALSLSPEAVQDGKSHPKAVMQDAFKDVLPATVLHRPKVAFQDGLGLKQAIQSVLPNPERYYRSEYERLYG